MRSTQAILKDALFNLIECNNEYKHIVPADLIDEVKTKIAELNLQDSMEARSTGPGTVPYRFERLMTELQGRVPHPTPYLSSVMYEDIFLAHLDRLMGLQERILALDCLNDYMRERIREVGVTQDTITPYERLSKLSRAMRRAMIGGCSCSTKTPEYKYHKDYCGYKILGEALDE